MKDLFLERWIFKCRSLNCLGIDHDSITKLCRLSLISEFMMAFLSEDSDTARTSGLAECAKAVNKTNLGRRLLLLTCMNARLLRLQKSTNESAWGMGVELGTAGPGLTSTSPEEQRRSRIRVRLNAIRTACLVRSGTESKRSRFLGAEE